MFCDIEIAWKGWAGRIGWIREYYDRTWLKVIVMWLKQCHKPSPSHHHFYRWHAYHSQSGVVYDCFNHINMTVYGGFLKWGQPQIIHFYRTFHNLNISKLSSYFMETSASTRFHEERCPGPWTAHVGGCNPTCTSSSRETCGRTGCFSFQTPPGNVKKYVNHLYNR